MNTFTATLLSYTWTITCAKLDATGHCWVASLANYNFALSYQSGQGNVHADIQIGY